jgi:hypothetical protein
MKPFLKAHFPIYNLALTTFTRGIPEETVSMVFSVGSVAYPRAVYQPGYYDIAPQYPVAAPPTALPPRPSTPGSGLFDAIGALFSGIAAAFAKAFRVFLLGDWRATAQQYGLQADLDNVWNFRQEVKGYRNAGALGPSLAGNSGQLVQYQQALVRLGYLQYATGYFDNATAQATLMFKKMRGMHQSYKAADGNWAVNEYATQDVQRAAQDLASRPFVVTYQLQVAAQKLVKNLDNITKNFKYVKPVMKWLGMKNPDPDSAESFFRDSKVAMEVMSKGDSPGNIGSNTAAMGNQLGLYASAALGILQLARTSANLLGWNDPEVVKAVDDTVGDLYAVHEASAIFAYAAN